MNQRFSILYFLITSVVLVTTSAPPAYALQGKVPRLGVVFNGREFYAVVEGLRDGLRELGLEEGKHLTLEIRDAKGDSKAVDEVARSFERNKVDLVYAVASSVTLRVKGATTETPIVFYAGGDPIVLGLVESFAKPGGRLTGVHSLVTDLTAKRLAILKDILPKLRRVMTFYDPGVRVGREAAIIGRDAARNLGIEFIERHVSSVATIRPPLRL